ncbi:MAG: glycine-rich protein [Flavobacteriales bacterium]
MPFQLLKISCLIILNFCFFLQINAQEQNQTFSYTGAYQTWVVPSCVTSIDVTLAGAEGGGSQGGNGAIVNGNLEVTPGQTLYFFVGGQGENIQGGFNGGGNGSTSNTESNNSFGGGGASDIRTSLLLEDRIVVAAGGGGTGGGNTDAEGGFGGCNSGGIGLSPFGFGGNGGTQNQGGNSGPPWINDGNYGQNGNLGIGGNGANDPCYNRGPGGGGGGGYFGGGGGGSDCYQYYPLGGGGGGGGSSLLPNGFNCNQNNNNGNGYILISYFLSTQNTIDTQDHCGSFTWIDGITYTQSNNTANYTLTTSDGCDSIVTLNLSITETTFGTDIQEHCNSYTWIDGNTYTQSNNTATYTITNSNGCDSIVSLNLTINETTFGTDVQEHCYSYTWIDGNTYTQSNNTANYTLTNSDGCDSIVTLNLTINETTYGTDVQEHCYSYTWIDGNTYTQSNNTATYTLTNSNGCDSIVSLNLTINESSFHIDSQQHCYSYTWIDGITYNSNNTSANFVLLDINGCDSIILLNLIINEETYGVDIQEHCSAYTWIDGNTYTQSNNTATHILTNSNGCDSIVTLNLTINNPTFGTDIQEHCNNYTWIDGNNYTQSNNTANLILTGSNGCDSIVTLNLTINNPTFGIDVQEHCNEYTWIDGNTYTQSNNTATHILTNSNGCDSIITLDLTIKETSYGTDVQEYCDSYTWIDGITYFTSNNSATFTLTNNVGCDSIITLNLTINETTYGIDVQESCNSFIWIDGNTYTASNNSATHTLINNVGCDSIVTLNLTIFNSYSVVDSQVHCQPFTWINGVTYSSSNNTAIYNANTINGCDSIITLNLTINNPSIGTDVQQHCNSYTWIDGITYTSNNDTSTFTLTNSHGCDSVVFLNLTIFDNYQITDIHTVCDSFTWIDGNTYTANNNTASFTLTGENGCDSIINLDLKIINEPKFEIYGNQNWCESDSSANFYINHYGYAPFNYTISNSQSLDQNFTSFQNIDTVTINQYGVYKLINYSDNYCSSDSVGIANIINRPNPYVNFTTFPQETDLANSSIYFRNLSTPNTNAVWNFGDENFLNNLEFNTEHTYIDTGEYNITLYIENSFGCSDSISRTINIYPNFNVFIPSAFSPNDDNKNDIFKPIISGAKQYSLTIISRWGEIIFQTSDINKGWNGKLSNGETYMPNHYSYRVEAFDYFGKKHVFIDKLLLVQ